ncbi:SusC/RagA family TonB-linked outer membrane protein [Spirosoma montaniterrae]|nr:TonB-dependent receptor [Spirosoma montaniterrae]
MQFVLLAALAGIAVAGPASAQEVLNRRVSLHVTAKPIKTVLAQLSKLTNARFTYSPTVIKANRPVTLDAVNQPLSIVLDLLLKPLDLTYQANDQEIVLVRVVGSTSVMSLPQPDFTTAVERAVTISGTVVDEKGSGLPGVSVVVKGTSQGTVTDPQGKYSLSVSGPGVTLVFSFVGYLSQEIVVGNQSTLNVSLTPNDKILEEVVVVGYGTQRRANVTGAIGSIKTSDINNITTANSSALIQGKVSGVRVENAGGAPGAGVSVIVRGTGTFGNDQPLYVIDGNITTSMDFLNPNDIESIEILKDASAAAIYGNRAANGVVLVTTKQGGTGQTRINFSAKVGIQGPTNRLDFMNARQYADYINQAADNDGQPRAPANTTAFNPAIDTDWQKLSISGSAPVQDYSLNLSGGNENAKFYISGQYFDQKGIVVNSGFKRYNFRANSTFTKGRFRLTEALSVSRAINRPNVYWGRERGEIPTIPVFNPANDGGFAGIDPVFNGLPRGINWYGLSFLNENRLTNDQVLGSLGAEYQIIDGLRYKLNLGLDYTVGNSFNYLPTFFFSTSQEAFNNVSRLDENNIRGLGTLIEHTLNYSKSFGKHSFDVLAGYTQQLNEFRSLGATGADFPTNSLRVIDASTVRVNATGDIQRSALQSVLGRINYNFAGKYLLSATLRRDGSSRFAEQNRFGTFPSISAGWRISEENFFPKNDVLNDVKLRASYGVLGSQNIGNYVTTSVLNINASYFFANGVRPGTALTNFANPNVVWETSRTTDIGTDLSFWNGKFTVVMDYYDRRSAGILTNLPIPVYGGVGSSIVKNAATIRNQGFEFAGTYNHRPGSNGLKYSITGNFSTIRNRVLALGEGVSPINGGTFTQESLQATRTDVGQPVGSFYGFVVDGIYQSQDQITADGRLNVRPGDFRYKDLNGDGRLNNSDRTYLGSPVPKFEYGAIFNASYRGFDLSMFIQGVQGNKIWNANKFKHLLDFGGNRLIDGLRAWTPQNTNTDIPRATLSDPANNRRSSSFYVEDGSYLRLRSMQLGYTIPNTLVKSLQLGGARVYVQGQNLLTFTRYTGYDPEIGRGGSPTQAAGLFGAGVDVGIYPQARSVFAGIDITF